MEPADLVLTGGTVHPVPGPSAQALAVRSSRIVAVGTADDVRAFVGPRARCIDLDGRTVVPGFVDAHVHPVSAGLTLATSSLAGAGDAAGACRLVGEYARTHPDEPWITGGGWSMEWFPGGTPSRRELDDLVPDRPVLLANRDGHGAWANSVALRLAGIDAGTPDPADGRIEREPDGSPQGTLHEGAVDLVTRLQPVQYPFADLVAAGARLCAGSDWPVSSADPLQAMHVAVNRRPPGQSAVEPLLPHQRLDPATFLAAYTAGSAWINHADADTGSLAAGKLADLAVLDADPLAVPPDRICDIRVSATFVGGQQVFGASE